LECLHRLIAQHTQPDALSELIAQFRVGDTGPVAVAPRPAARKPNPVHAVQKKIMAFAGRGERSSVAPAQPAAGWEEF